MVGIADMKYCAEYKEKTEVKAHHNHYYHQKDEVWFQHVELKM